MSDLTERLREYGENPGIPPEGAYELAIEAADQIDELESKVESLLGICGDPRDKARIEELEWLVAYVINGLNDWSDGQISYSVFFTDAAAKRVRALEEKDNGS